VNILLIVQLLLGVTLAFTGAGIFRSIPPLGGFILGGLLGITIGGMLVPAGSYTGWLPYILFIGSGLVGALLAIPLQIVIIVLSGTFLGALFGVIIGFLIENQSFPRLLLEGTFTIGGISNLQIWIMIILSLIFGLLSIQYEDFMFYASTSFIGSIMITTALASLGANSYALLRNPVFLFFFFIFTGLIGTIWQNYHTE
jgi:hypothetical protein